jgi:hypothetical protein
MHCLGYVCGMISIDVSPAINTLRTTFGRLTDRQFGQGVARALNHTAAKAQTAANKTIREVYNIKARDVRRAMRMVRARPNYPQARIDITGAPLPLLAFGARQLRTGVSVAVKKGERKKVQRAFVQTMPSGHKGVFARGGYERGKFGFRTQRVTPKGNDLPITELTGPAVPMTLSNEAVMRAIAQGMETHFAKRLEHELSRIMAGIPPAIQSDTPPV